MFRTRWLWRVLLLTAIAIALPAVTVAFEETSQPSLRLIEKTDSQPAAFEVVNLPSALLSRLAKLEPSDSAFGELLTITVADKTADSKLPSIAGSYRVTGDRLLFVPRFPVQPGLTYRSVLNIKAVAVESSSPPLIQNIAVPMAADPQRPATFVRHIYPTSDLLPENHLRFYIEFSQPMARAAAYQNLELQDEQGNVVEAAFLELGEELWDPASQRFTLLLDPGRIKRGLKPREEDGPILEAGKKYTLIVKRSWLDGRGQMLKADVKKTFTAGPALDKPLDVKDWKVESPLSGGTGLLSVRFPAPLDYALLNRLLTITDRDGHEIKGRHIVCNSEKRWTFAPDKDWQAGSYFLVVDTVLEDSAGNRIGRAFEVDQVEDVTDKLVPEYVKIPFEVQSKETAATKP